MQQDRISNGMRSGKLNAGQTANLEKRESNLNKTIASDRAANGGGLTNNQKTNINGRQNNISNQIYKDKNQ